jgi:hypothetical protein
MNQHSFKAGDFIKIKFGYKATQLARVEGLTKTGKLVIRRFNASRDHWQENTSKINCTDVICYWLLPIPHDQIRGEKIERDVDGNFVRYHSLVATLSSIE